MFSVLCCWLSSLLCVQCSLNNRSFEGLAMKTEKLKKNSFLGKNVEEFASRSSVHGLGYVFDKEFRSVDRLLWLVIFLSSLGLAIYLVTISFNDWQDNQVITTVKVLNTPISKLRPAITICAPGLHMDQVEKVLYANFKNWTNGRLFGNNTTADDLAEYMREEFQIEDDRVNILDILNTMISPEAAEANSVRQYQLSCAKGEQESDSVTENMETEG